jgi:uncharacterized heparinase superfamily protein
VSAADVGVAGWQSRSIPRTRAVGRVLRTARHIPLRQLAHRAQFLVQRRLYALDPRRPLARARIDAARLEPVAAPPGVPDDVLWPEGLGAVERRAADFARGRFVYLNREADFSSGIRWRDLGASPLWLYQLHYLGALADLAATGRIEDARRLLASWRAEHESRWDPVSWHPYPASIRFVNLCAAASRAGGFEALGPGAARLAATHVAYLLRHVERDVRGNHILENARGLLWAGRVFHGGIAERCERMARALLEQEVPEQVLPDGGHFEMSPMYHCVVMRGLLEIRALLGEQDPVVQRCIAPAIGRMGPFLADVLCPDGDIPPIGDSVRGFGPPPGALLRLAGTPRREWTGVRSFVDTGLHVLRSRAGMWAIVDAGPTCPPYLPAHGQADVLTIEVWAGEACLVADPGVHDYTGPERAWGRSSRAHSTLTVDDLDTSEVYDSFRVGGRARVVSVIAVDNGVAATVRPFGVAATLRRSVRLEDDGLTVEDAATCAAGRRVRSRLHLHPGVTVAKRDASGAGVGLATPAGQVRVEASARIAVEEGRGSREFGRVERTRILVQDVPGDGSAVRWRVRPCRAT